MSYNPSRIIVKNIETYEMEIKPQLVQINLDLISKETKRLNDDREKLAGNVSETSAKLDNKKSPIVASLLFG